MAAAIKRSRVVAVLKKLEDRCQKCRRVGTWYCNTQCSIPGRKAILEHLLKRKKDA